MTGVITGGLNQPSGDGVLATVGDAELNQLRGLSQPSGFELVAAGVGVG